MVAIIVDGVFTIGKVAPDGIREEFMLRLARPVYKTSCVAGMNALHFLQKDNIGAQRAQLIPHFVDHHPVLEKRKAFMDVIGGNA